jgi:hypothetical protein
MARHKIFTHITDYDMSKLDIVKSETTERGRVYFHPNGCSYPSVTTVMSTLSKEGIDKWKLRVGEEEAKKILVQASRKGTKLHDMCERYIMNEENYKDKNDIITNMSFKFIQNCLDKYVDDVYGVEKALYSDYLGLAGKTDLIAKFKGKLSVIDFKTSKKEKTKDQILSYFLQATSYSIMFEELTGIPINNLVILMTFNDGGGCIFEEKRDNYVEQLMNVIKKYNESMKC